MQHGMPRAGYVWSGCLLVLLILSILRSGDATTRAAQAGAIVGGVLGPVLVATLVWLVVSLFRRRLKGYPAWVALLAVGVGVIATLADAGNRAREDAEASAATSACEPEATRYGTEPPGFTYTPLEGEEAQSVLDQLEFDEPEFDGPDVVLAEGRSEDDVLIFISIELRPGEGLDNYVGGVRDAGRPVERRRIGGREAALVFNEDGSRIAASVKGCHIVLVLGAGDLVQRVAPAVFERA